MVKKELYTSLPRLYYEETDLSLGSPAYFKMIWNLYTISVNNPKLNYPWDYENQSSAHRVFLQKKKSK